MTLRTRMALLMAAGIAVALVSQGIFSYFSFRQTLYNNLDQELGGYMAQIIGQLRTEDNNPQPAPPRPADVRPPDGRPAASQPPVQSPLPPPRREVDTRGKSRLIVGGRVTRSWNDFPIEFPLPSSQAQNAPYTVGNWRVHTQEIPKPGRVFQAIISEENVLSSLSSYRQSVGVTALLVSLLGAWLAWWLTGLALQPLRALTQTAKQVAHSGDLSLRVTTAAGGELGDLSHTFNEMLERLTEFLTRETQFTRNASHELRTPLTSLTLYLSAYRQGFTTPVTTLKVVTEEVERMTRLTASLLTLAREQRAVLSQLDLGQLAARVALETGVTYTGLNRLELMADPILLRQALDNLLENARKYAPDSEITIHLTLERHRQKPFAVLSVRDQGSGLSTEALTRATQAFYRAPGVRVAGSGLGLSVVEQIAKVHQGHLELRNNTPHGLEVQIWLPLDSAMVVT